MDIRDAWACTSALAREAPEIVLLVAAAARVDWCQTHPGEAEALNVRGAANVASAASQLGAHVVYTSTNQVFDGGAGSYGEDDQPLPINVYGRTKLAGEAAVAVASPGATIARLDLLYGWPLQSWHFSFVSWILGEVRRGRPVELYSDQRSTPIAVWEAAAILWRLALAKARGVHHVAGPDCVDRWNFGRTAVEILGGDVGLVRAIVGSAARVAPRPASACMKSSKAEAAAGLRASGIRKGLAAMAARRG